MLEKIRARRKRAMRSLLVICAVIAALTFTFGTISWLSTAGEPGDMPDPPAPKDEPIDPSTMLGMFHCHVEIRDDLHRPNAFFGVVETYPGGNWPAVQTVSHTAETLAYTLIQIRGLSVPSQFTDRTRPLIFSERERARFDKAMSYVWALISQSETLILRNPVAVENEGYVICDVSVKIGGHDLDLATMLIADGHARPIGLWDWGARDVYEITE